jgi:hypothetical protein
MRSSTNLFRVLFTRYVRKARLVALVAIGGLFCLGAGSAAQAAASVQTIADTLVLKTEQVSLKEALDVLASKFAVTYQIPSDLDTRVSGTYTGTLNQVLARLFDGFNYMITRTDERTDIIVLGPSGGGTQLTPVLPAAPAPSERTVVTSNAPKTVATHVHAAQSATSAVPPLASYLTPAGAGGSVLP